jgi:hypothetical protein
MNFTRGTETAMRRRLCGVLIGAAMLAAGCGGESERAAQKIEIVPGLRVQKMQLQSVADELGRQELSSPYPPRKWPQEPWARFCRSRCVKATSSRAARC